MQYDVRSSSVCKLWDVERALGVSRATLYRWCNQGVIQFTRLPPGHIRVPVSEVERLREIKRAPEKAEDKQ